MSTRSPVWRVWLLNAALAVLWVVALVWLASQMAQQTPRQWLGDRAVRIQWEARFFQVPPDQAQRLLGFSSQALVLEQQHATRQIENLVDDQLSQLFSRVEQRIPAYVDWHFSLTAEAGRWAFWLGHQLQLTQGDYLAAQATDRLFGGADWDAQLVQVSARAQQQWQAVLAGLHNAWSSRLLGQLAQYEVPAPLAVPRADGYQTLAATPPIDLQNLEQGMWQRAAVGGGAGIAAGLSAWRALSVRAATARITSRGVARVGSAAAGSAVICSPGGPGALGCAVVAGTATWLATEWAMLQAEKALTQAALTQALQTSVNGLREEMRNQLIQYHHAALSDYQASLQAGVTEAFVPMQRWR